MGLFGSILGSLPIVGSFVNASQNRKAIKKSSAEQVAALQRAIAESTRQFDVTQANFAPYMTPGAGAMTGMGDLTGINGGSAQMTALEQLRESPFFKSIFRTGEEAVLQNAAATGGLRGGNTQRSLADFGADAFSRTIQQQLQNLGGIAGIGSGMAGNLGNLGAANAQNIGNMMVGQGNARAGSILGQQNVNNALTSQLSGLFAQFMPGLGNIFGSIFGGGGSKPGVTAGGGGGGF